MPQPRGDNPLDSQWRAGQARVTQWLQVWQAELIVAFVVLWVAYGFLGFNLSTAGDDWVALTDDSILIRYALENGRWLHALLMAAQDHSRVAPTFSIAVLLLAIVAAMAMFANALQLKRRGTVALFVVLAGCFPFWAEFASFRILHLPGALALLLSCGYGYVVWRGVEPSVDSPPRVTAARLTLAGLLFSLSAATYQGFLPVGVMLLGCYLLGQFSASATQSAGARQDRYQALGIRCCLHVAVMFGVGVLLYSGQVLLARIVTGVGGSAEPTYQLAASLVSNADDLRMTLTRLGTYLWAFYAEPNHLFPLWPKLLFLLVLLVFLLRVLIAREFAPVGKRLWVVGVLCVLCLSPWALGLIRVPDPYRYNAIVSAGLVYAVVICYTLDRMRAAWGRALVFAAGIAIAVCFVFQQNSASHITHQNNLRDMAVVNRLLDRLTTAQGYAQLSRHAPVNVVLSGDFQLPTGRPFHSAAVESVLRTSIVDCDILRCQPARLDWATPLVSADSVRYTFVRLKDQSAAYQAVLQPVVNRLTRWPARRSVQILDDTTVVVRLSASDSATGQQNSSSPGHVAQVGLVPVTASGDGFVLTEKGVGAFSVGLSNFGEAATYLLTVLPSLAEPAVASSMGIAACQTQSTTGTCLDDPVSGGVNVALAAGQSATFAVFVSTDAIINKDVLGNRLVVRVADDSGKVLAATSVAVASGIP